ncbi:MAG: HEPN domain-containing protein [Polaromonas sp.]
MTPISEASLRQALELLTLALRDQVAAKLLGSTPEVDFSIIAFHTQQCIEKCMKAVLAKHLITYPRTHDLDDLYKLLQQSNLIIPVSRELLNDITPYSVTSRYTINAEDLVTPAQIDEAMATTVAWATLLINS